MMLIVVVIGLGLAVLLFLAGVIFKGAMAMTIAGSILLFITGIVILGNGIEYETNITNITSSGQNFLVTKTVDSQDWLNSVVGFSCLLLGILLLIGSIADYNSRRDVFKGGTDYK